VVWNHQLPEWQQKSLSRLRDCYTADPVPNSKKWERKWRSWRGAKEGDVSGQCAIADLDSRGHLQRLWIKRATFVQTTEDNSALGVARGGPLDRRVQVNLCNLLRFATPTRDFERIQAESVVCDKPRISAGGVYILSC
jgi:hypothetical protein